MIYFNQHTKRYEAYHFLAKYDAYGQPTAEYTNDRIQVQKMVGVWGHLDNLRITDVVMTADQQARLDAINSHPELDDLHSWEASEYVEYGIILPGDAPAFLADKVDECGAATRAHLVKETIAKAAKLLQQRLDSEALSYRYDNMQSAIAWAGEFDDADMLKKWGAQCWKRLGELEEELIANVQAPLAEGAYFGVTDEYEILDMLPTLQNDEAA